MYIIVHYKLFWGSISQIQNFISVLYLMYFSLKFRLLALEFFPTVQGKGFFEGLLTKRFTATKNLTCKRKSQYFYQCPQLFTVSCTAQWTWHLWNSFCVSTVICDTNSDEFVEDTESDEDEDDFSDDEQPSPPIQHQIMKWWLQSQANQMHVPKFMGGDRSKKQNETLHIKKIQHLWAFSCCIL